MVYVPGSVPYAPQTLSQAPEMGMSIADMMLRNANQQAALNSAKWGSLAQGVEGIGGAILGGMREHRLQEAQDQENEIRKQQLLQAQQDMSDRQAFSQAIADPSMKDESGKPDLGKLSTALAGRPGAMKLFEGYTGILSTAQKLQEAQAQQQTVLRDGLADSAHHLLPLMQSNHDAAIEPFGQALQAHAQLAKTLGIQIPGLDVAFQHYQQASQAMAQAKQSGDPAAAQAVADTFRQQVGPMLEGLQAGASSTQQEKWAKAKKEAQTLVKPNETLLGDDNKPIFTAGPEPITPYQQAQLGLTATERAEQKRHNLATEEGSKFQPKEITVDGKPVEANFDPKTGKFYNPDTGAVIPNVGPKVNSRLQDRLASAEAVNQTGDDIIQKLKDPKVAAMLGPAMGRATNLREFLGNPPPELADLAGSIESYALASMGVHGMRNAQAADKITKMLDAKHTPESLIAKIQGIGDFGRHLMENQGFKLGGGPVNIKSDAEWEKLAPGTAFIGPDGKLRTK